MVPKWTYPTLSQEAIRQNGGVTPPPEPILPMEFTIQLYNPDQQVVVRYKPKSWNTPASWEFEMPQQTFRQPSSSTLDRRLSDPAASHLTPKLRFNWRKDGKLSKDFTCYLSGKTVNPDGTKKKNKEPDITIALFQALKEVTLYEPNLYRVDMEDFKGLEVVLLIGSVVIRDVYMGQMRTAFNISDPPKPGSPMISSSPIKTSNSPEGTNPEKPQRPRVTIPEKDMTNPPPADPREQWERDAERARSEQQTKARERERRRREKEEEKRTRKLLEAEQREAQRKQSAVDQETERLKKLYAREDQQYRKINSQSRPHLPTRPSPPVNSSQRPYNQHPPNRYPPQHHHPPSSSLLNPYPQMRPNNQRPQSTVQFLTPRPSSMANLAPHSNAPQPQLKEKRSIFGFRKKGDGSKDLSKKRSSMF